MSQNIKRDPYRLLGEMFGARYRLDDFAGMGSFGAVYRATDTRISRIVAVKILKPDIKEADAAAARELFQREALTAGRLVHPNIVAVTDTGEEQGFAYLVMEWLEGRTLEDDLREKLNSRSLYTFAETADLLAPIADALQTAHDAGVIHRDIKPSNIHLGRAGHTHVKVLDFGIAKVVSSGTMTEASRIAGTLAYMSPEQLNGAPLDRRADIYALGVMLHQMLTGALPFEGGAQGQVAQMHLNAPPPLLHTLRPDAPPALSLVLQRALAKNPNARQQTTNELHREFVEALQPNNRQTMPLNFPPGERATPTFAKQQPARTWSDVSPNAPPFAAPTEVSFETVAGANVRRGDPNKIERGAANPLINQTAASLVRHGERISNSLRPVFTFALVGAIALFVLSIAVGLTARWLGITIMPFAYDEFVLQLLLIAVRDAIFGAFLGAVVPELRSSNNRFKLNEGAGARAFLSHGAAFAAVFMLPFVVLRTSLFFYAVLCAFIGFIVGLIVCGARLAAQKVKKAAGNV
jgi:serine/threonine protein kinase